MLKTFFYMSCTVERQIDFWGITKKNIQCSHGSLRALIKLLDLSY